VKNVYIASRVREKVRVRKLLTDLKEEGITSVTFWIDRENARRGKDFDIDSARKISIEAVKGINKSDIFILLSDEGGTGMYVELGLALARNANSGVPKIYLLGDHRKNSVFSFHPSIILVKTEQELLSKIRRLMIQ